MEPFGEGDGFFGITHIRLGNNLDQRRTGAIEIYTRDAVAEVALME